MELHLHFSICFIACCLTEHRKNLSFLQEVVRSFIFTSNKLQPLLSEQNIILSAICPPICASTSLGHQSWSPVLSSTISTIIPTFIYWPMPSRVYPSINHEKLRRTCPFVVRSKFFLTNHSPIHVSSPSIITFHPYIHRSIHNRGLKDEKCINPASDSV